MNEAFWRGTGLTRTTPATQWRAKKSTTFRLASALTCLLPPGSVTYLSALLVSRAPWMLTPWTQSSNTDIQSLHRSLLELLCELWKHFSMPFLGIFQKTSEAAQFGPPVLLLKHWTVKTWCKVFHMTFWSDIYKWHLA